MAKICRTHHSLLLLYALSCLTSTYFISENTLYDQTNTVETPVQCSGIQYNGSATNTNLFKIQDCGHPNN